jgi:hypothetical protein
MKKAAERARHTRATCGGKALNEQVVADYCVAKAEGKMITIIAFLWTSGEKALAVAFGLSALAVLFVLGGGMR